MWQDARMLFASASLARRIERAEATLIAEFGRIATGTLPNVVVRNFGGAVAVVAGAAAPFSKVAGLGFEPVDEAELAALERNYAEHETPVRVELATLGDPEVGAMLTRRGYTLAGFENVLAKSLPSENLRPTDIAIAEVDNGQLSQWVDVLTSAFAQPDKYDGPAVEEKVDRASLDALFHQISEISGFVCYCARRNGEMAGGAGMRVFDGVAQLCGAGTLPAHRRRGVQTALLQHRLAEGARAGCDIAVVTTQPGSVSQQNVQRQGFELLYSRAVLMKSCRC
jgi:GNAT superfamily N-acetyltransferase